MKGQKILITGATGQVAGPVAKSLAADNEVVAIARFGDAGKRADLEAAGVRCKVVDLAVGDFSALPRDFDTVLNFAVARMGEADFEAEFTANGEAPGLLMSHCRDAKAFLHCSSTAVYEADGHEIFDEASPLGDNHRVMMPTYSIGKIATEVVVRYAAREFGLPTVIARLNTPYGDTGGWPFFHLMMMKNGVPIPVHSNAPSRYTLFHQDDIVRTLPAMVESASVPANIVNWSGQQHVAIEEWCGYIGELTGLEPKFAPTDATLESVQTDNAKMQSIAGPAQVDWRDGIRRMVETMAPDLLK